ncbi:hypothetical protein BaRGS_00034085 [Batillaria attramentaria]|uniref:Ribosomal protein L14 n=1 Tax=Batillaria attramentaria TaxID=370345 RepID=A0ABD0JJ26_9CAEN
MVDMGLVKGVVGTIQSRTGVQVGHNFTSIPLQKSMFDRTVIPYKSARQLRVGHGVIAIVRTQPEKRDCLVCGVRKLLYKTTQITEKGCIVGIARGALNEMCGARCTDDVGKSVRDKADARLTN